MKIDWDAGKPLTLLPRVGRPIYTGVSMSDARRKQVILDSARTAGAECLRPISGGVFALLVLRITCRLPAARSIPEEDVPVGDVDGR